MNKEELLIDLNKEAKKLVKKRIVITRLILGCVALFLCWYWNLFSLPTSAKLWQASFVAILFLSNLFWPLWRITPEKVRYAFYEVAKERAQECINRTYRFMSLPPTSRDLAELTALQEENSLFGEIMEEIAAQIDADVALNASK